MGQEAGSMVLTAAAHAFRMNLHVIPLDEENVTHQAMQTYPHQSFFKDARRSQSLSVAHQSAECPYQFDIAGSIGSNIDSLSASGRPGCASANVMAGVRGPGGTKPAAGKNHHDSASPTSVSQQNQNNNSKGVGKHAQHPRVSSPASSPGLRNADVSGTNINVTSGCGSATSNAMPSNAMLNGNCHSNNSNSKEEKKAEKHCPHRTSMLAPQAIQQLFLLFKPGHYELLYKNSANVARFPQKGMPQDFPPVTLNFGSASAPHAGNPIAEMGTNMGAVNEGQIARPQPLDMGGLNEGSSNVNINAEFDFDQDSLSQKGTTVCATDNHIGKVGTLVGTPLWSAHDSKSQSDYPTLSAAFSGEPKSRNGLRSSSSNSNRSPTKSNSAGDTKPTVADINKPLGIKAVVADKPLDLGGSIETVAAMVPQMLTTTDHLDATAATMKKGMLNASRNVTDVTTKPNAPSMSNAARNGIVPSLGPTLDDAAFEFNSSCSYCTEVSDLKKGVLLTQCFHWLCSSCSQECLPQMKQCPICEKEIITCPEDIIRLKKERGGLGPYNRAHASHLSSTSFSWAAKAHAAKNMSPVKAEKKPKKPDYGFKIFNVPNEQLICRLPVDEKREQCESWIRCLNVHVAGPDSSSMHASIPGGHVGNNMQGGHARAKEAREKAEKEKMEKEEAEKEKAEKEEAEKEKEKASFLTNRRKDVVL